jgi:Anti-sigma-K factor rskA, C-terminal
MTDHEPLAPPIARLLEDPAVWAEVSPDLRARTLAAAVAAGHGGETEAGDVPAHRVQRRRWRPMVLAAAAAVLVLALAATGGVRLLAGRDGEGVQVALAGTEDLPGASATAELRDEPAGVSIDLDVSGLPPAPDGTFYEAWLVGDAGKVSAGTFHRRGDQDHVQLWLGVDTAGYDAITVTRQPVQGGTLAEGVVVLRGELPADR